jgi:hypothetical protein
MKGIKLYCVMACLFAYGASFGQEKVNFEYRYQKGKEYAYRQETIFETVFEMYGQETKNNGSSSASIKARVEEVAKTGDITFRHFFDDFRINTKMGAIDTNMMLKELTNKDFFTTITRKGKLVESKMIDTINLAGEILGNGMSSSDLSKEFIVFPDRELKTADTWDYEKSDTVSGTQLLSKMKATYTLVSQDMKNGHSCWKITYKGTSEMSGKVNQMGMDFFMEGTGDITGTVWFDANSGILVAVENNNTQDMTMAMTGQMQMTIPLTTSVTSKFYLVE